MPSPSNIYAEKAYSEHPIAMWALDDQLDYVSYISTEAQDITSWSVPESVDYGDETTIASSPLNLGQYLDSGLFKVSSSKRTGEDLVGKTVVTSPVVSNFADMDQDLATFSIGTYLYSDTEYVKSFVLGFTYIEEITQQVVRVSKQFDTTVYKNWIYVAETFDIPNYTSNMNIFIEFNYYDSEAPETEYEFYVNGLSLGQWSEEFQSESLGLRYLEDGTGSIIDFPSDIAVLGADKAVVARAYGLQDLNGYYLATENKLYAKNSSMPLVFGASNTTRLLYNEGLPSLVLPGNGFMNNIGKHSTYTLEAWMRIDSISTEPHKIFGPVASEDGIYVDNERIYLKISDNIQSASITEWGTPMLVHVKYLPGNISLIVNSEELVNIPIDVNNTFFPAEKNIFGQSQDWIGFYSSDDVSIDLDCVAIYPYEVDKTLAKRKWVYGQNVEYPENLNAAYDGKTVAIDYSNANYAGNFSFPRNSGWSAGIHDNIRFTQNSIASPQYLPPEIILESGSSELWLDNQNNNNFEAETYIRMKPGESWSDIGGYLYLDSTTVAGNDIKAIYGIFKSIESYSDDQILIKIRNKSSGEYFSIVVNEENVLYKFYNGQTTSTLKTTAVATVGEMFLAGINVEDVSSYFGGEVIEFFSTIGNCEVFIAGDNSFENTYFGNIYTFAICNTRNAKSISSLFGNDGVILDKDSLSNAVYDAGDSYFGNDIGHWALILNGGNPYSVMSDIFYTYVATYKVMPKTFFGNFVLDVATHSFWEDYVPLSHFAKYVKDASGNDYYDLDFIQLNIGYPAPGKFVAQKTDTDSWTYAELQQEYGTPTQYTYAELDNELFSGYVSYEDLKNRTKTQQIYDTSKYSAKTYVTFQYIQSGANSPIESYTNTESVSSNNLVKAGDEWVNTKYEVIDGTVIYPPRSIKFSDLAIVIHVEIISNGSFTQPVIIRSIDLASQALDSKTPTEIGTKFGVPIYPYTKSGIYFNYKNVNPFKIYKRGAPYLFLSRNSGIELVGDQEPLVNRGISVPLNSKLSNRFDVAALQVLLKYGKDFFPYSSTPIFEIQAKDSYIKFYLVATHPNGQRAKIYAINSRTGKEENGIAFYVNGKLVKSPTLSIREWTMVGISFTPKLNLNSYSGAFRVNGRIMVNHVSYYQSTGLQEKVLTTFRVWDRVKETISNEDLDWDFWKGDGVSLNTYAWNNVLVIGQVSNLGISLPEIFKAYVGTNKLIFEDNSGVRLSGYRFRTYRRVTPVTFTKKPS
jgi:hypothetical protein